MAASREHQSSQRPFIALPLHVHLIEAPDMDRRPGKRSIPATRIVLQGAACTGTYARDTEWATPWAWCWAGLVLGCLAGFLTHLRWPLMRLCS